MNIGIAVLIILGLTLLIVAFPLLYPHITRKGLLFGVYVGEERWGGREAQRITRTWNAGIVLWSLACAALAIGFCLRYPKPNTMALIMRNLPLALFLGILIMYLWAYFRARVLAAPGLPPPAAAILDAPESVSRLPVAALATGIVCGLIAVAYAAIHYPELPARIPTRLRPSGGLDVFQPKSFLTVMRQPLMTLVMGIGLGIFSLLVSRAKRAIRLSPSRLSVEAQLRFRKAVARFLSLIAILVTAMLTIGSIGTIRVGLGRAPTLSPLMEIAGISLGILSVGGVLLLIFRYGQGGSRLEATAGNAPLTNGLADNRHWVLGIFYVNRNDPSLIVERRFGFGYTINFGNWKAVSFVVGFLILILALAITAGNKG